MRIRLVVGAVLAALVMALVPAAANAAEEESESARIHLLHGIPETTVDVVVADDVAIEDFAFGDTFDLSGFSGQTLEGLKVNLAGTDTTVIDAGDTALPAEGNFTVIAHLDAEGTPTISVFENDTAKIAAEQGRLTVRHTAAAPAVDILANSDVAFANVVNGKGGSVDLPTGTVSASVVPAGETAPVVIGPAEVDVTEGQSLIVYAVGSLEGESLTVLTETVKGMHSTPKAVHTGTSPVESSFPTTMVLVAGFALVAFASVSTVAVRKVRA